MLFLFVINFFGNEDINFQISIFLKWGKGFPRGGPLEKLWGGGEFSSRRIFFRYQIPCINFSLGHSMNIF